MARTSNFKEEYPKYQGGVLINEQYQGGKYTLLTEYVNAHTKCTFKCNECNLEFEQTPNHHKKMKVCPCNRKNEIVDIETIKLQVKEKSEGKYSLIESSYHSSNKKAKFICDSHGEFSAIPYKIISGRLAGCKKCGKEAFVEKRGKTTVEFIAEAIAVHGELFDYSKCEYTHAHGHVTIICPKHGEFQQMATNHLRRIGCPKCGDIRTKTATTADFKEMCERFREKHDGFYEYPDQEYINNKTKIKIVCPKHGNFYQRPVAHLQGNSCPKCANKMSKPQIEITEFIRSMGIEVEENTRSVITPSEIDIWMPEHKIGIEFNGLVFHREGLIEGFGAPKLNDYHLNKTEEMERQGYRLIHIFEDEWMHKQDILKSKLSQILNQSESIKINARKCNVREINFDIAKNFLEKNHIQGRDISKYRYGLFHGNKLVAVMTFLLNKEEWKLNRYATLSGYSVRGGASKLLKYFERENYPKKLVKIGRAHV